MNTGSNYTVKIQQIGKQKMSKKILIVDDEPDILTFVGAVLKDNGYTCISAKDGMVGLELLHKEKPDLVLLDLLMPKKTGISMFQEMKNDPNMRDIKVVVITGLYEKTGADFSNFKYKQFVKDESNPAETEGVMTFLAPDGHIEKPIDPDLLIKVVQKTLNE
jgi:CheY-like chemotaxis protein